LKESLKQKITESQASIDEIATLLEKNSQAEDVIAFFKDKGVEFSKAEAEDFLVLMKEASQAASSTKLDDDALTEVSGGVGQTASKDPDIIDTARYLACKAAPFLAGCDRIIRLYESRGY